MAYFLLFVEHRDFSLVIKRPVHEAIYSPPSSGNMYINDVMLTKPGNTHSLLAGELNLSFTGVPM